MGLVERHEKVFYLSLLPIASISVFFILLTISILSYQSFPAIKEYGLSLFLGKDWVPSETSAKMASYGLLPAIIGTLLTSIMAVLISTPLSLSLVVFSEEVLPRFMREKITVLVDLMAGIPTIIYGIWGLGVLAPFLKEYLYGFLNNFFGWIPLFSCKPITSYNVMSASIVLSIMILPFIYAIIRESYRQIPFSIKEAVHSLGATTLERTRVLFPLIKTSIIASVLLGFGRSAGETVAVSLVIGNVNNVPSCVFQPGYTISSLIANQFSEAGLFVLMENALFTGGLVLVIIGLIANVVAIKILSRRQIT